MHNSSSPPCQPSAVPGPQFSPSTSGWSRFMPVLIALLLSPSAWSQTGLKFVGDLASTRAFMADLAALYSASGQGQIELELATSTDALVRAASGEVDFGGSARPSRSTDRQERRASMYPIVWDALVVVVNTQNPLVNLSLDQLQNIYAGNIQRWNTVGGTSTSIDVLVHSDPLTGIDYSLSDLLLGSAGQELPGTKVATMEQIAEQIATNPDAMAVVTYSAARNMPVKILSLEGRSPAFQTIQSGDYMLYTPIYLAIREDGRNRRDVRKFLRFAGSAEAKRILRRNGVVPYADALALVSKQLDRASYLERLRREP